LPSSAATAISLLGLVLLAWSFVVDVLWLAMRRHTARTDTVERVG
jgi:hypothetical protein